MLAALLSLALAQAPAAPPPAVAAAPAEYDVVVLPVVRPRVISRELAEHTAMIVRDALVRAGYSVMEAELRQTRLGKQDPADCQNNVTCFALIGRSLRTPVVVRLEGGVVETDLAVYLQALRSDDGTELAAQSIVTRTDATREEIGKEVAPFIAHLLVASPPRTRLETPPVAALDGAQNGSEVPGSSGPPTGVVAPGPSRPLWPLAPAAAGVVGAAVGAIFVAQAGATHAQLVDPLPPGGTPWTQSQAEALRDRGNFQQTLGWALIGVGAVATATGAVLYFTGPQDSRIAVTPGPGGVLAQGAF